MVAGWHRSVGSVPFLRTIGILGLVGLVIGTALPTAVGAPAGAPRSSVGPAAGPSGGALTLRDGASGTPPLVASQGIAANSSLPHWVADGPPRSPPPRLDAGFATDTVSTVALVFGGYRNSSGCSVSVPCPLGDTWIYKDATWSNVTPAVPNASNTPSPRWGAAVSYDPGIPGFVLFGGTPAWPNGSNDPALSDTWVYDEFAREWTAVCTNCSAGNHTPPARWDAGVAYDPASQSVVVFGGESTHAGAVENRSDTWLFNGTGWTEASPSDSPSGRSSPAVAWDAAISAVLLFGGVPATSDTWTFSDGNWTALNPAEHPSPRGESGAATDPVNGSVVLFGGCSSDPCTTGAVGDLWDFAEGNWHPLTPSGARLPDARDHAGFAEQAPRDGILLFGGDAGGSAANDTWSLYHLEVYPPTAPGPAFDVGETIELSVATVGGTGPLTYVWSGLPPGCSTANLSLIVCTPAPPAPYPVTVRVEVSDPVGDVAFSPALSFEIDVGVHVTVVATPTIGAFPLNVTFATTTSGGTGGYRFNWTFGDRLNGSGPNVTHLYRTLGNFTATVVVNDSSGATDTAQVAVRTVNVLGVNLGLSPATITTKESAAVVAAGFGGVGPYSYSFTGLASLDCTGTTPGNYSCTTARIGTYPIEVRVSDQSGQNATANATLTVVEGPPGPSPPPPWWEDPTDLVLIAAAAAIVAAVVISLVRRRRPSGAPSAGAGEPEFVLPEPGLPELPPATEEAPEGPREPDGSQESPDEPGSEP